ncbi:hypothetical protein HGRIS_014366 [Hohenbuehelia grisea]|uniref:DNA 3'-5' helicase n=1 Tax=Hohenbuehelia grisea TaxID=104357 RepID=A0ABR3JVD2_9AGAR
MTDNDDTATSLTPGSVAWFTDIITPRLGYSSLRDWQIDLGREIFEGRDVVCVAPTGSGKSALLHIPLMAAKEAKGRVLGMSIAPTKILCEDQAQAASARGLRAIALHSDSIRVAKAEGRNLIREIMADEWDLFVLPPELLNSDELATLLHGQTPNAAPKSKVPELDLVFIDECHLVREHGDEFREAYKKIVFLRGRLPVGIPWVAVTATLPPGEMTEGVLKSLGFCEGEYRGAQNFCTCPLKARVSSSTRLSRSSEQSDCLGVSEQNAE